MTVSILFITHSGIGLSLMTTLINTFGHEAMAMKELSIDKEPDPELLSSQAEKMVNELDQGDGVLVFTDMIGSTPCNIAQRLMSQKKEVRIVSGVNLPMLFRVFNYPDLSLDVLAIKALNAGREGILEPVKDTRARLNHKLVTRLTTKKDPNDKKASSDN